MNMKPIKVFVGYDSRESVGYHVFCESLISKSSRPLSITPLSLSNLRGIYSEEHTDGSNEFIYSRFLVPYLSGFQGISLFFDGDMIINSDPVALINSINDSQAVCCVKHDYKTRFPKKYFGNINENYPRKNWSSVIVYNNEHPQNNVLTPEFISAQSGAYLHRFRWLDNDVIGELPVSWNWLINEYPPNPTADLFHYTLGIPCLNQFQNSDHATEWFRVYRGLMKGYEAECPK